MTMGRPIRVFAFDPGSAHIGYAMVDVFPSITKSIWIEHGKLEPKDINRESILDLIAGERVDAFAIEKPVPRAANALAQLIGTAWIGGLIEGILRSKTDRIQTMTSYDWKRTLCGNHVANDAIVANALGHFSDVPKRTNPHSRDAAAIAIVVGWGML